ncbi:hypothetical protein C8J57DRAFT_1244643 [Mycena rebaudengoi]|nr:hypothetical protein C8J57DRAFT_1244643 [Mycena rebaudengoi]
MFNPTFLVLTSLALALCGISHPVSGFPIPAAITAFVFRPESLGRKASETLPRATCHFQNTTIVRDVIPNQYTVLVDEAADHASHLKAVEDFIHENKRCAALNNIAAMRQVISQVDDDTSLPAENYTESRSIKARRTEATWWVTIHASITIQIYQHSPGNWSGLRKMCR